MQHINQNKILCCSVLVSTQHVMAENNESKEQNADTYSDQSSENIFEDALPVKDTCTSSKTSLSISVTAKTKTDSESSVSDNYDLPQPSLEDLYKEDISFDCMMKHVSSLKAQVSLLLCASIVIGINDNEKTTAHKNFLNHVFRISERKPVSADKSLTYSCAIILGTHPFDEIYWQNPNHESDDAVACLVSYFANLCKTRNQSPKTEYHKLLEFLPATTTDKDLQSSHPEVYEQLMEVYDELKRVWGRLPEDKNLQRMITTGLGLVVMFNFSHKKAAQDILPIVNHYCTHAVSIACYNSTNDARRLLEELQDVASCHNHQSKSYLLLKQLCGVSEQGIVVLTETNNAEGNLSQENKLIAALKERIKVNHVHHMQASHRAMEVMKCNLEKSVIAADSFYKTVQITFFLLLFHLKNKCKSFWKHKSEIESLSKIYQCDMTTFLQIFTSYGKILYFHDIPKLQEYVIINIEQFVERIHCLYQSEEVMKAYGMFEEKEEKDEQVIFEILTAIGKAAEVKCQKIVHQLLPIHLHSTDRYYFIPTTRCDLCLDKTNALELISLTGYTKENLLACLCECLLQKSNCLFIPTTSINTVAIRFEHSDEESEDIEFIDSGDKVMVRLLNSEHIITEQRKNEIYTMISSNLKRKDLIERKALIETLHLQQTATEYDAQTERVIEVAQQLTQCSQQQKTTLANKLGYTEEWLQQKTKEKGEYNALLIMLFNLKHNNPTANVIGIVQEHGIDIK